MGYRLMPIVSKEPDAVDDAIKAMNVVVDWVSTGKPMAETELFAPLFSAYLGLKKHQAALKNKIVIDVAEVKDVPIRGIGVLVLEKLKQLENNQ